MSDGRMIEVYADITCPFAHVGLRRVLAERRRRGADDVGLRVRSWPLELVNGEVQDGPSVAEKGVLLRRQVAPTLFGGLDLDKWPHSTLSALALADAAYDRSLAAGEAVNLALRDALFEHGRAVDDPEVLAALARDQGVTLPGDGAERVRADWVRGQQLGVVGSPHFVVGDQSWFCPSLVIDREGGELVVVPDEHGLDPVFAAAFD